MTILPINVYVRFETRSCRAVSSSFNVPRLLQYTHPHWATQHCLTIEKTAQEHRENKKPNHAQPIPRRMPPRVRAVFAPTPAPAVLQGRGRRTHLAGQPVSAGDVAARGRYCALLDRE